MGGALFSFDRSVPNKPKGGQLGYGSLGHGCSAPFIDLLQ